MNGTALLDALKREIDHRVHIRPGHRRAFGCALDFNDVPAACGDDVEVDACRAVLGVAKIESVLAIHVANADRCNLIPNDPGIEFFEGTLAPALAL